jgi:hypothetical protein
MQEPLYGGWSGRRSAKTPVDLYVSALYPGSSVMALPHQNHLGDIVPRRPVGRMEICPILVIARDIH